MKPVPFIYTTDMSRSIGWYRTVAPNAELLSESPFWSELDIGGVTLALHAAETIVPGGGAGVAVPVVALAVAPATAVWRFLTPGCQAPLAAGMPGSQASRPSGPSRPPGRRAVGPPGSRAAGPSGQRASWPLGRRVFQAARLPGGRAV